MTDNILHLYQCAPNQKAMDWLAAEMKKIGPSLNQIPLKTSLSSASNSHQEPEQGERPEP